MDVGTTSTSRGTTMSAAVRWAELSWPEIEGLLAANPNEVGLLPVGATE